jgi:hypothetical protein
MSNIDIIWTLKSEIKMISILSIDNPYLKENMDISIYLII